MQIPEPVKVERKILEKHVEARLVKRVKEAGGKCYKWSSANVRGVFDRIVVMPGPRVYFVELKKDGKAKLTPHQKKFLDEMLALGVITGVTIGVHQPVGAAVLHGIEAVDAWCDIVCGKQC